MDIFRDKHDVADAHAELVDYQKSVGDEHGRRCDPPDHSGSLFEGEFHALGVRQERHAMLLAQNVLRTHQHVEAVRANEADDSHPYEPVEPAAVVERLVHRQDAGSEAALEQVSERLRIAESIRNVLHC